MILPEFNAFVGEHCETTAVGSLLLHIGEEYSEPMLFGLGEGLGFIYWKMKNMEYPFIGGRAKPDVVAENICRHLNLKLEIKETASLKKAWRNVEDYLTRDKLISWWHWLAFIQYLECHPYGIHLFPH